jgi:hypothetical protein
MINFPWYKWHATRWLSSHSRLTMNTSERSIYRDLLDHLYLDGSIPNNPKILALLAAVSDEEFAQAWPTVAKRFIPCADDPASLTNANAEDEIRDRALKAETGAQGGRPRVEKRCPCGRMTEARAKKRGHRCQKCQKAPGLQTETETKTKTERETQEKEEEEEQEEEQHTCAAQIAARVCDDSFSESIPKNSPASDPKEDQQLGWFNQWWDIFWLKRSRKRAFDVFRKVVRSDRTFQQVMDATRKQLPEMMAKDERHRPYPETWLSGERWLDLENTADQVVREIREKPPDGS